MSSPTTSSPVSTAWDVSSKSDADFAEVVETYVGLVYSAALRRVRGDHALAQDVTQTVFLDLARRRAQSGPCPATSQLGPWLYRRAWFAASDAMKSEARRRQRERTAAELESASAPRAVTTATTLGEGVLDGALDEALLRLRESDRSALVMRFIEGRDLRSIGHAAGISEDAAQKRVARALVSLRKQLRRRGFQVPATTLTTYLASQLAGPAPLGLAALITGNLSPVLNTLGSLTATTVSMTAKIKVAAVATGIVGLAIPLVVQTMDNKRLRNELSVQRSTQETPESPGEAPVSSILTSSQKTPSGEAESEARKALASAGEPPTKTPDPMEEAADRARRVATERYAELLDKFKDKLALTPDQEEALEEYYATRRPVLEEYLRQSSAGRIDPKFYFINVGYRPHIPEAVQALLTEEQAESYQSYESERRINYIESFTNGELSFLQNHLDLTSAQKDELFGGLSEIYTVASGEDLSTIDTLQAIADRKDHDNAGRREIYSEVFTEEQMVKWEEVASDYKANVLKRFGGGDLATGQDADGGEARGES